MSWFKLIAGAARFGRGSQGVAEVHSLLNQLEEAKIALGQQMVKMENQFLQTSSELEKLSQHGNQFVEQVEKLIGVATGKDHHGSIFEDAIQLIEDTTKFLGDCQNDTAEILKTLQHHNIQIDGLLSMDGELQRAMLPLSIVQTLFRMESVQLGVEVQQMFGALTQQIESLHSQMRETFGIKFKQLEETHRTIGHVITQLDRQLSLLKKVTSTDKMAIEKSLEELKKELSSNQNRDVQLRRLSHELSHEVNQIVMGLQFQDILNQKLQHVLDTLPQITEKFACIGTASNAVAAEAAQFLQQSCRLESEQVDFARKELAGAEKAIQTGVQKVLGHLSEADSQCLSLEEFKLLTTSFDGIVQVLVETIEDARKLVSDAVANAAEAYNLLRPLGTLASDLTTVIRGMSSQIRLIGLNAQVQAAQATHATNGRGAGLEVLSIRTSEITGETNRISEKAAIQLDSIVTGLAGSIQAFKQLHARGQQQRERLESQGKVREEQLHAFRDGALEMLRAIDVSLDNIRKQAERTLATVQYGPVHEVALPGLRKPLSEIGKRAERWLKKNGRHSPTASLVDDFKKCYTMESERAVFNDVLTASRSITPAPSISENSPPVDLFFDPSDEKEIELPAKNELAPDAAINIAAQPAELNPSQSPLGDNVELF